MLTLRLTPATSTRASRFVSSMISRIWPGIAKHTVSTSSRPYTPRRYHSSLGVSRRAAPGLIRTGPRVDGGWPKANGVIGSAGESEDDRRVMSATHEDGATQTQQRGDAHDPSAWSGLARQLRVDSVRASSAAGSGHPTSSLSAADLMAVLVGGYLHYDFSSPEDASNDHLIFSKGHASPLLYSIYRAVGAVSEEELLGLPAPRQPAGGTPHAGLALGRRRQWIARTGAAHRGRRGPGRKAARPASLPGLGPVRRQRDGRGVDVGGVRARRPRGTRQPHGDRRRQPARPAWRDDARLGPRALRGARGGLRLARDRD